MRRAEVCQRSSCHVPQVRDLRYSRLESLRYPERRIYAARRLSAYCTAAL